MRRVITGLMAALTVTACTTPAARIQAPEPGGSRSLETLLRGEPQVIGSVLDKRIAKAAAFPLGSKDNPVRAQMPQGQQAYLVRLRCGDGRTPSFVRIGSYGVGVFGNIIDGYAVDCGGAAPGRVDVFMDMYHPGFVETRAVPGFTIDGGPVA